MADHDILTEAEGRRALGIDAGDSTYDVAVAHYVTAVSELLDREAGPVVQRAVANERHNGGRHKIILRRRPAAEITTVVEYQYGTPVTCVTEAAGTMPANGWLAEFYEPDPTLFSGTVYRRSGGEDYCWWRGRQNIVVGYTAGRYEDTESVADRFKRAAGLTLINLWRDLGPSVDNDGEVIIPFASFPGFALPNAAAQLLAGEVGLDSPWGYR